MPKAGITELRRGEKTASLQLPEAHERKLEALRAAIIEGEQSGASRPFDLDAFISRRRRKSRRAATETA